MKDKIPNPCSSEALQKVMQTTKNKLIGLTDEQLLNSVQNYEIAQSQSLGKEPKDLINFNRDQLLNYFDNVILGSKLSDRVIEQINLNQLRSQLQKSEKK